MKPSLYGLGENSFILSHNGLRTCSKSKSLMPITKRNPIKPISITLSRILHFNNYKASPKRLLAPYYPKIPNPWTINMQSKKNYNKRKSICLENAGIAFKHKADLWSVNIHGLKKTEMDNLHISWIKCISVFKADSIIISSNRKSKISKNIKMISTKISTKRKRKREKRKELNLKMKRLNKANIRKSILMIKSLKETQAKKRLKFLIWL